MTPKSRPGIPSLTALISAGLAGLIVLIGYFLNEVHFAYLRGMVLQGGVALAGTALAGAALAYFLTQLRQARRGGREGLYAGAAAFAFLIAAWLTLWQGTTGAGALWMMEALILPAESALLGVLTVLMLAGMTRMLGRRKRRFTWTFYLATLICLGASFLLHFNGVSAAEQFLTWFRSVPGGAGVRGVILGAALGGALAGLRVLAGFERPYDGDA